MLKYWLCAFALLAATPALAGDPEPAATSVPAGAQPVGVFSTIDHRACLERARQALRGAGWSDIAVDGDHVRGARQGVTAVLECRAMSNMGQLILVAFPGDTRPEEETNADASTLLMAMTPGH